MFSIAIPSPQTDQHDDEESQESFRYYVANMVSLPDDQSSQWLDLLLEYRLIFLKCPGLNKLYTCSFYVSNYTPFKIRPYPVPFAQRPAVKKEL